MNLAATIEVYCFGTSEGAKKAWDTRGRGKKRKDVEPQVIDRSGWFTKDGKFLRYDDRQMEEAGHGDSAVDFGLVKPVYRGIDLDQEATSQRAFALGHIRISNQYGMSGNFLVEGRDLDTMENAVIHLPPKA